jgi:hypothetical protein
VADVPEPEEIERWHRWMAGSLFNRAWELLEAKRTPDEDRELLAAALASWLHWRRVGSAVNRAVADWQVARVFTVLGEPARAAEFARESLRTAEAEALGPFYVGYACEALARAAALAGDGEQRGAWLERARRAAADVTDAEEQTLLEADLDTV